MSVDREDLQRRWRGLVRRFPIWRFPFDLVFDANSWRMFGADLTSMVIASRNVRIAARELDGASPATLDAISQIANVNAARTGELFRTVLLTYVSLPLGFAALLSDAAPDTLRNILNSQSSAIVAFLIGTVVFPIVYFCGYWRAKQIEWIIQLFRAGAIEPAPSTTR